MNFSRRRWNRRGSTRWLRFSQPPPYVGGYKMHWRPGVPGILSCFMTRRRWIIVITACVVLLTAVVTVLLNRTAEPVVQGRRLSHWVNDLWPTILTSPRAAPPVVLPRAPLTPAQARTLATPRPLVARPNLPRGFILDPTKHNAAAKAIRELGTNAVPHLLRPVYLRDGKFKARCVQWARKQSIVKVRSAEEKRGQALSAMSVLGADALWAWVEIVTNDLADPEVQVYAAKHISTLGHAATPALPVLLTLENHREPRAWSAISWAIQQCDRDGVLPSIRQLRRSSDAELRASAAWSLGFVTNYPDITIPALVTALGDLDARVRDEAVQALGKFSTNAVSATNAVRRAMADPEARVRDAATNALNWIVPAPPRGVEGREPEPERGETPSSKLQ
jgi:hypothetical protein